MSLRTEAYYRGIATETLDRIGATEPPIALDDIVASLGIPVRPVNLPLFFTAATVYEDGLPVMVINWAQPEQVRRGALAHMLGHVLLVLHGDGNSYPRDQDDHREADLVARELLLPTQMVIDQGRLWFNDYRYLARLFGVSESEMLSRMQDMGLVRASQGVAWDF
ncbi:MAG: ImmA/IrrE family metallo-endopeptidase [Coriobacteriia bacterium]|nr:ImmA/IrrE family metallo-endopeptidase [Coriobacteriia bacterium]